MIKPAFPSKGMEPVFGGRLGPDERARLIARITESPHEFAGQELLNLSAVPVWSEEHGLTPRRVVLRVYLAAEGDSWIVIPGGLARVSPSIDTPVVSMQRGGGSKDTWVLSDGPVDTFTLAAWPRRPGGTEPRCDQRPAQPCRRSHLLARPLRRAQRAPGPHASMHSHPADRSVGHRRRPRMGIPEENVQLSRISAYAAL